MKRIRMIGAVLVAMFALGALAATGASANTPEFLGPGGAVGATEHLKWLALSLAGSAVLLSSTRATVVCGHLHAQGTFLSNGLALAELHFLECKVQQGGTAFPNCTVESKGAGVAGLILVHVHVRLVYTGSEKQAEKNEGPVGDLFSPETGSTFVTLAFAGTCPSGVPGETAVTGSVIGNAEPGANTMVVEGLNNFPESAVKKGYVNEGGTTTKEYKASLKIFGTEVATQISPHIHVFLESEESWGILS